MIFKVLATIFVLALGGTIGSIVNSGTVIASGNLAAMQMQSSDTAYVISQAGQVGLGTINALIGFISFLIIILIWLKDIKKAIKEIFTPMAVLVVLASSMPQDGYAYFDTSEKAEAYTILPNQSAIWIPDVGDNKNSQTQLNSEEYLNANKIAAKRFAIPHHKFQNSGGWGNFDKYVPDGRLIIIDRTTFSREWVHGAERGSSAKDESIPCQSKEGLNIRVGISIGATVTESNAAKYLYHFGVTPPTGDPTSGEIIFTSVYYSRKVAEVMDDVGRKKVQTLICNQIASRTFDDANDQSVQIMAQVEKDAQAYFTTVGITLDFIGWADTFKFDEDVQEAVNKYYIAAKLNAAVPTLQALGSIKVQEGLGKGLEAKGPPMVLTPGFLDGILNSVRPAGAAPAPIVIKK